jgi:hypothetical protein
MANHQPHIAAKSADFTTYSERFATHSGTYVQTDDDNAGQYQMLDEQKKPKNPGEEDAEGTKHGGTFNKGFGKGGEITTTGDPTRKWGTPTDPHEIWPNNPGRSGAFDGGRGGWDWKGPGRQGEAYGSQHPDGVDGQADIGAWLAKGDVHWQGDVLGHPLTATAEGGAEVRAGAHGALTDHGFSMGGDTFAGAEIGGKLDYPIGPVDTRLGGALQYGVGLTADLDAGMQDGKFVLGGSFGGAWGVGGKISPHIAIDPKSIESAVESAGKWLSDLF